MRIALLGVGLIGGSIARALRSLPVDQRPWIAAWSPGEGARAARTDGAVDELADDPTDAVTGADLVILAGPATTVASWFPRFAEGGDLAEAMGPEGTLTDVASTKEAIVAAADAAGIAFVGGHPMAGRESSGYLASTSDLFVGRPWVVVRGAHARETDVDKVEQLARACRARPIELTAPDHDAAVAAVSHLPLVVAAALVESVAGQAGDDDRPVGSDAASELAASGWASMTRLARGDAAMGAAILATNGPRVVERLRSMRDVIDEWIAALDTSAAPDEEVIRTRLAGARIRLERGWPERSGTSE